jgi:hypothetical protein
MVASFIILSTDTDCIAIRRPFSIREVENGIMDASAINCNKSSGLGAGPEGFLHLPLSQNFEIQNQAATSPSVHSYANLSICEPNLHFHMVKNKEGLSLQKQ